MERKNFNIFKEILINLPESKVEVIPDDKKDEKVGYQMTDMLEIMNGSGFNHFGILPQVCIHSPIEDEYSRMYIPRDICDCGSGDWIDGEMKMFKDLDGYEFPKKKVHRCAKCNEVRIADHVSFKNKENG